jgi:hypothetical protein
MCDLGLGGSEVLLAARSGSLSSVEAGEDGTAFSDDVRLFANELMPELKFFATWVSDEDMSEIGIFRRKLRRPRLGFLMAVADVGEVALPAASRGGSLGCSADIDLGPVFNCFRNDLRVEEDDDDEAGLSPFFRVTAPWGDDVVAWYNS